MRFGKGRVLSLSISDVGLIRKLCKKIIALRFCVHSNLEEKFTYTLKCYLFENKFFSFFFLHMNFNPLAGKCLNPYNEPETENVHDKTSNILNIAFRLC